ncbi:MAG: WbqC-like family protein [Bacteroidetes bacterium]|nr:WbqC-like family protein [Bacteroidota bacterium]
MNFYLTTAYLAPISYYAALVKADRAYLEQHDNYQKQSYRNRCHIAAANGLMALSIPVEKPLKEKSLTRDIRISAHNDWQVQHWRSIFSAYNSSPFFEYYQDDFQPFFENKWNFLWDFNMELLDLTLGLLDISPNITLTDEFKTDTIDSVDLRETIHPKKNVLFESENYYQVFENKSGFIHDLSIIDLLFNMGNESIMVLEKMKTNY